MRRQADEEEEEEERGVTGTRFLVSSIGGAALNAEAADGADPAL